MRSHGLEKTGVETAASPEVRNISHLRRCGCLNASFFQPVAPHCRPDAKARRAETSRFGALARKQDGLEENPEQHFDRPLARRLGLFSQNIRRTGLPGSGHWEGGLAN